MSEWLPEQLQERVLGWLCAWDSAAVLAASGCMRVLALRAAAKLVRDSRARPLPPLAQDPGPRWLRALGELHAPARLVAVGGYNSEWNRHEEVKQEGDGNGCERSVEVVCSLRGPAARAEWRRELPAMRCRRADVAVAHGEERCTLYAVGGRHGEERHASVERLDLLRWQLGGDGWSMCSPMREGRSGLSVGILDNHLLAAGGRGVTNAVLRSVEALDLSREGSEWRPLQDTQFAHEYAASAVLHGEFWMMGGGSGRTKSVEVLDGVGGSWREGPEMGMARYGACAVAHEGRLFVVGGSNHFARKRLTSLEWLDPREGEWHSHTFPCPSGPGYCASLWGSGVALHGETLLLCGGAFRESQESQTSIYRVDLRTMELETLDQVSGEAARCGRLRVPRWCGGACMM